jgi:predicted ATPase/class 3 adenylate cyclase/predicted negative regulator of RcsB-dependent stress response
MASTADDSGAPLTFLFADLESSTRLWEQFPEAMKAAMERHDELGRRAVEDAGGRQVKSTGDGLMAVFASAADAVKGALCFQQWLAAEPWPETGPLRARIGLHSGAAQARGGDYFGPPVYRAARIMSAAHGGQVLLSGVTADLVRADGLPSDAALRDLGDHQLKDLLQPERVFQLTHPSLPSDFPPLATLTRRNNLPIQLASFVGRREELAQLRTLLVDRRLITLLGPGGVGKTRLALQAAAESVDLFADGVWFVDLAPLRDGELLAGEIAAVLELREQAEQSMLESVTEYLRGKTMLLVLDNLEQVMPAAAEPVARLLGACSAISILATSRTPLHIRGEHRLQVAPLGAGNPAGDPAPDDAELPPAVELFVQRARAIQPDLEVNARTGPEIAAICRRLDGLPLAIEIAAARLSLFSLPALRARLEHRLPLLTGGSRDLPERQQTLRATIVWSDELLSDLERRLFYTLGVFVGSFDLDAVAAVADKPIDELVDSFAALVEHSLVRSEEGPGSQLRYTMLETIREYALDRLAAAGEADAAVNRLADHLLAVATEQEPRLRGPEQIEVLQWFDAELTNLRHVLGWLEERADPRLAALVTSLHRCMFIRGMATEGRRWVAGALAATSDEPSLVKGKLLQADARFATGVAPDEVRKSLEQAIDIYRSLGERRQLAVTLLGLGYVYSDPVILRAAFEEARDLAHQVGDVRTEASAIGNLGLIAYRAKRLDEAQSLSTQAIELLRKVGDTYSAAIELTNGGNIAHRQGDFDRAVANYQQALGTARDVGEKGLEGWVLLNLAAAQLARGDPRVAGENLAESIELLLEGENLPDTVGAVALGGSVLAALGNPEEAPRAWAAAAESARSLKLPDVSDWLGDDPLCSPPIDDVQRRVSQDSFANASDEGRQLPLAKAAQRVATELRSALERVGR